MEKILEKEEIQIEENKKIKRKNIKIFGISIWRIFAYFVVYSILGYIIETIFGIARYGMLESRKSFLYGPFCAIYGVGAVIMIVSLQNFKKSYNSLFVGGCIVGSVIEYLVSFIGEIFLHLKWWDYSTMPFNLNGRICLLYSIFWGFLALYLMVSLNPKIDKFITYCRNKMSPRFLKNFIIASVIFMLLDCILTAMALSYFTIRVIKENNIDVKNQEYVDKQYEKIYKNIKKTNLIYRFLGNEKMIQTFPRLTIEDKNNNIIYIKDLYPDIQSYYYKFRVNLDY